MKVNSINAMLDDGKVVTESEISEALALVNEKLKQNPKNATLLVAQERLTKLARKKADSVKRQKIVTYWFTKIIQAIISGSMESLFENFESDDEEISWFED